jgi:glycosyltransferase involved in cell wall biosynthesis
VTMRIVITVPSLEREFGGPSSKAIRLGRALTERGDVIRVVGCGSAPGGLGLPTLGRFHGTPIPRSTRPLTSTVKGADVVHIIGLRDPVGLVAALTARRRRIPFVVEPVGMHRRHLRSLRLKTLYDRLLGDLLLRRAASIIATSEREHAALIAEGISPDRVRLRVNGVDVGDLLPLPARGPFRSRLGIGPEVPVALVLARIYALKGLNHFADAIARIPGAVGVVAGPDERDGTLQGLLEQPHLRVIPGGIWGEEKAQALADADCVALPSESESFGSAAAEAACVGIPVVVTRSTGIAEWLNPQSARVVDYGDIGALASAMEEAMTDRSRRAAAEAAAPRLREALDWSNLAEQQAEIYRAAGAH